MAKITLPTISGGYASVTQIEQGFNQIESEFQNKVLYRNNPSGEANQMENNIDMNGFLILNQANPITISGFNWEGNWVTATTYQVGDVVSYNGSAYICIVEHTSGTFATDLASVYWQVVVEANLPAQAGNSGKSLTTDGSTASWTFPEVDAGKVNFVNSATGGATRTLQTRLEERISVTDFGAVGDGTTDDTAAIQAAFDSGAAFIFIPPGIYRCNSTLTLPSSTVIQGVMGQSWLYQYGSQLFQGPNDLVELTLDNLSFDFRGSPDTAFSVWGSFKSHRRCTFSNLYFVRYADQTILERYPDNNDTINTTDNVYKHWLIESCYHVCISMGHEGTYTYHFQGDGATTVINTGISWPELFNSSVVVLKESSSRVFTELTLGTDYSLNYAAGVLTVTMVVAPTANERIHIWPSSPMSSGGGNRRPISNNIWRDIQVQYLYKTGWTDVRWVDAERYELLRLLAAADYCVFFRTNPYTTRGGEAGDFATYECCVLSYRDDGGLIADPDTLRAFDFGPGSHSIVGNAIIMDLNWENTSNELHIFRTTDTSVTATPITVNTTAGSPIITSTGVSFRNYFTLLGTPDKIRINGVDYSIASIDTTTQITLGTNFPSTLAGTAVSRVRAVDLVNFDMQFANIGSGFTIDRGRTGRVQLKSATSSWGTAVITAGNTSVDVTHNLRRAPELYEIYLTAQSSDTTHFWVSNITSTTFRINMQASFGTNRGFGWCIDLKEAN